MTVVNPIDTMWAGNYRVQHFTIVDASGAPLNLTGYTATYRLTKRYFTTVLATKVSSNSAQINIYNQATSPGQLDVFLQPSDTAGFDGFYSYQLELTDASGNPTMVATGDIQVNLDLASPPSL